MNLVNLGCAPRRETIIDGGSMRWIMGTTRQKCHSHERVMSADRTVLDSYRAEKSDVINDRELEV